MTTRSEEYFQALGAELGLDVQPDSEGACLVAVEGGFGVTIRGNDEAGRMELSAVVADELPEVAGYPVVLDLLSMSLGPLFDAPGVGREPESGAIVMYALFPFETTTLADFAEAVPQFIDRARGLADRLAALKDKE